MIIHLKRYSYGEYETEGRLFVDGHVFATIEQPWTPNPAGHKGGKPFESCIPDGMYRLAPFKRPDDGDADHAEEDVWIIFNPDLGVYRLPDDHPFREGRDLCLIHKGNWSSSVQGCIAPGLQRYPMPDKQTDNAIMDQAVRHSKQAMAKLRELLGTTQQHILSITNDTGASDIGN